MTKSFVAAETSPPALLCGRGVVGRGVTGRRRSTDWDRLGPEECKGVETKLELVERESRGDGHLLEEEEDDVVEVEVEVEGEGDMYLEETCLPLGCFF